MFLNHPMSCSSPLRSICHETKKRTRQRQRQRPQPQTQPQLVQTRQRPHQPHVLKKILRLRHSRIFLSDADHAQVWSAVVLRNRAVCVVCQDEGWLDSLAPPSTHASHIITRGTCGHALCAACMATCMAASVQASCQVRGCAGKFIRDTPEEGEDEDEDEEEGERVAEQNTCRHNFSCHRAISTSTMTRHEEPEDTHKTKRLCLARRDTNRNVSITLPSHDLEIVKSAAAAHTVMCSLVPTPSSSLQEECPTCSCRVWATVLLPTSRLCCPSCDTHWCLRCKEKTPSTTSCEECKSIPEALLVHGWSRYTRLTLECREATAQTPVHTVAVRVSDRAGQGALVRALEHQLKDLEAFDDPVVHCHCSALLTKSTACNELRHCDGYTCNICGAQALPWEESLPASHWFESVYGQESHTLVHVEKPQRACARWDLDVAGVACSEGVCKTSASDCVRQDHASSRAILSTYRRMKQREGIEHELGRTKI